MKIGAGVVGAVVGGAIGSAAWAAISHFGNFELGWIASITGALAGFGFKLGFPRGGVVAGVLAAVIGVTAIAGGKVAALVLDFSSYTYAYDVNDDRDLLYSFLADEIIESKRLAGEGVEWPGGRRASDRVGPQSYDRDIWKEAAARWDAMTPAQREEFAQLPIATYLDEYLISAIADDVSQEWGSQGRVVAWPEGAHPTYEYRRSWYDPEVWEEAEARWASMPEGVKDEWRADRAATSPSIEESFVYAVQALPHSLSLFDALWVVLGVGAAYKIAAGEDHGTPASDGTLGAPRDDTPGPV